MTARLEEDREGAHRDEELWVGGAPHPVMAQSPAGGQDVDVDADRPTSSRVSTTCNLCSRFDRGTPVTLKSRRSVDSRSGGNRAACVPSANPASVICARNSEPFAESG